MTDETPDATAPIADKKPPIASKSSMAMRRDMVLRIAFGLAILVPIWFVGAALGTKFGIWGWKFGLGLMTIKIGPLLIFATLIIAIVGLVLMLIARPFAGWKLGLIALIIPAIALSQVMAIKARNAGIPPIHDISTDPQNPLQFSTQTLQMRIAQGETNPIVAPTLTPTPTSPNKPSRFASLSVAQSQRLAYPTIAPLIVSGKTVAQVGEAAKSAAHGLGLVTIKSEDCDCGAGSFTNIEATATTFWFGFKDDVAISVKPQGNDVRVDVRSVSRVGTSDLGANAKRVEALLKAIRAKTD
jgi:fatty-acyl-CoA synthase